VLLPLYCCWSDADAVCSRGVDLIRAEYVPDNVDEIEETVLRLRQKVGPVGFVFSSGGIGPTHDDKTYGAIAEAFGEGATAKGAALHTIKGCCFDSLMCEAASYSFQLIPSILD
jgi:molybdopterin-biosynthesis enzyme MoeA-like protein